MWKCLALPYPAGVGVLLGYVHHGQLEIRIAFDADRLRRCDVRGAPELKLVIALAEPQLGAAGLVGARVERTDPDLDIAERLGRVALGDRHGQFVLGLWRG